MKPSEKRLLTIFLSLLVLGALWMSFDVYAEKRDELTREKELLELEWVEIEALFDEKEIWEMRANWLGQNQPPFTSTEAASQAIFSDALAEDRNGILTSKQTLLPVEQNERFVRAGVSLHAAGELAALLRWIYDITRPTSFRAVRNLSLQPDPDEPGQVVARFELLRYYAPPAP